MKRERLFPHLQAATFSLDQSVGEPGQQINYCYFPTSSVISLLYTMQDASTAEMGLIGNEGGLGIAIFLGGESTCGRAIVAVAGDALMLPRDICRTQVSRKMSTSRRLRTFPDLFSRGIATAPNPHGILSVFPSLTVEVRSRPW